MGGATTTGRKGAGVLGPPGRVPRLEAADDAPLQPWRGGKQAASTWRSRLRQQWLPRVAAVQLDPWHDGWSCGSSGEPDTSWGTTTAPRPMSWPSLGKPSQRRPGRCLPWPSPPHLVGKSLMPGSCCGCSPCLYFGTATQNPLPTGVPTPAGDQRRGPGAEPHALPWKPPAVKGAGAA